MFMKDILKDWGLAHLPYYDWYLDYFYDTTIKLKHEPREKFGEVNLKKATSTNST
jgi:hypothetical protein